MYELCGGGKCQKEQSERLIIGIFMSFCFLLTSLYVKKNTIRVWNNWNSHELLVGMKNGTITLENSLAVS